MMRVSPVLKPRATMVTLYVPGPGGPRVSLPIPRVRRMATPIAEPAKSVAVITHNVVRDMIASLFLTQLSRSRNPKSEYRNPKQTRSPKPQIRNGDKTDSYLALEPKFVESSKPGNNGLAAFGLGFRISMIRVCFGFRYSDFGFFFTAIRRGSGSRPGPGRAA